MPVEKAFFRPGADIKGGVYMRTKRKKIISVLLSAVMVISMMTVSACAADKEFTDLDPGKWYYDDVKWAVENGYMVGVSDKCFDPGAPLTRGMFVTILGRAAGAVTDAKEKCGDVFSDVRGTEWYAPFVKWAFENNIVKGVGNGMFDGESSITREQMAVMIKRFADESGAVLEKSGQAVKGFADENEISGWAVEAVDKIREAGIIRGDENNRFAPLKDTERAQAAAIFRRTLDALKDAEEDTDEDTALKNADAFTDFGAELFRNSVQLKKNELISPFSVFCAMSMLANGAGGATLSQLENVMGMSRDDMNKFVSGYVSSLPDSENISIKNADSVWMRDDDHLTVRPEFLDLMEKYYDGEAYVEPFDTDTADKINGWVKEKTDGMIPSIINEISEQTMMYLINALYFDAKWQREYTSDQVIRGAFRSASGEKQEAKYLCEKQLGTYIGDDDTDGFIKYYDRGKYDKETKKYEHSYAFAALLPKEGIEMEDYIDSLDGDKIRALLNSADPDVMADTRLPKFDYDSKYTLPDAFKAMGVKDAFDKARADLSPMASYQGGNLYVSDVIHKTRIELTETGTRAAAVTAIVIDVKTAIPDTNIKKVYLDRPFVYMIVDMETGMPMFIGVLNELNSK